MLTLKTTKTSQSKSTVIKKRHTVRYDGYSTFLILLNLRIQVYYMLRKHPDLAFVISFHHLLLVFKNFKLSLCR